MHIMQDSFCVDLNIKANIYVDIVYLLWSIMCNDMYSYDSRKSANGAKEGGTCDSPKSVIPPKSIV